MINLTNAVSDALNEISGRCILFPEKIIDFDPELVIRLINTMRNMVDLIEEPVDVQLSKTIGSMQHIIYKDVINSTEPFTPEQVYSPADPVYEENDLFFKNLKVTE